MAAMAAVRRRWAGTRFAPIDVQEDSDGGDVLEVVSLIVDGQRRPADLRSKKRSTGGEDRSSGSRSKGGDEVANRREEVLAVVEHHQPVARGGAHAAWRGHRCSRAGRCGGEHVG
jgi:hypothetical protein